MTNKEKFINGLKYFFRMYLWLIPVIIIIDYVTKLIAFKTEVFVEIIPNFFYFDLTFNKGAAWSILEKYPQILACISLVATGVMIFLIVRYRKVWGRIQMASISLMLAGTVGNMIDRFGQFIPNTRFYDKGVIDFISFIFHFGKTEYHFPIFNVADMSLVIGVIMLVVYIIVEEIVLAVYKKKINEIQPQFVEFLKTIDDEEKKTSYNKLLEETIETMAKDDGFALKKKYMVLFKTLNPQDKKEEKSDGK